MGKMIEPGMKDQREKKKEDLSKMWGNEITTVQNRII